MAERVGEKKMGQNFLLGGCYMKSNEEIEAMWTSIGNRHCDEGVDSEWVWLGERKRRFKVVRTFQTWTTEKLLIVSKSGNLGSWRIWGIRKRWQCLLTPVNSRCQWDVQIRCLKLNGPQGSGASRRAEQDTAVWGRHGDGWSSGLGGRLLREEWAEHPSLGKRGM